MFDFIAFVAMAVVFVGVVYLVIWLGDLPANIAQERNHPQVAAVRAMAWLGLLFTGGIVYIFALVWAFFDYNHTDPVASPEPKGEIESLRNRITALEKQLATKGDAS